MVGEINNRIAYTPLEHTWEKKKELDSDLKGLVKLLSG